MFKLPILEKNSYLSIVIKDNGLWSHLAYTDHNAQREYILSDFTDLNPLRHALDDEFLTKQFWFEYFDNLEKVFGWDIVDKNSLSVFTFRKFKDEGDGLNGIRIQIDDNQKFFNKMFSSIRDFSQDISLRVIDDKYMQDITEGLLDKGIYDDVMYVDTDLLDFSIYRAKRIYDKKSKEEKIQYSKSKMGWKTERQAIEAIQDSRFKAFLASDIGKNQMLNFWSNFVLNRSFNLEDPNIKDILRSYSTIQNHSLFRDNSHNIGDFGVCGSNNLLIVSGYIPRVLGKKLTLLSLVDGLELDGSFDCYWDLDTKLLSFGKSYSKGSKSEDVILTSKDMMSTFSRVVIPNIQKEYPKNKVLFSGKLESLEQQSNDFFALASEFNYIEFPNLQSKFVVEGEFQKGVVVLPKKEKRVDFVSRPDSRKYESLVVDVRKKPVVYGPDSYANKLKLQTWMNNR